MPSLPPQHMVEEFWYAVPETCLLFAAFREDFSPIFVGTLTLLFFFKAFHWLADVRIDFVSARVLRRASPNAHAHVNQRYPVSPFRVGVIS